MFYLLKGKDVQELLRPLCLRMVEEYFRICLFYDFPALQKDDAVCDRTGKLHLMNHDDHLLALLSELRQIFALPVDRLPVNRDASSLNRLQRIDTAQHRTFSTTA